MPVSTNEEITYREATSADSRAVAVVNVRSWQESFRGVVPQAHLDGMNYEKRAAAFAERFEQRERARVADGGADFYQMIVAERAGASAVGYVDFGPPRETRFGPFAAELYSIYVLPEQQRRGVGGRLFRLTADALLARGRRSMYLQTLEASPYRNFYERMGGRPVGRVTLQIGGVDFVELAYGWDDLSETLPK
ncbi:MAG TPA: GNAT family N-acetyltransferase [Pyrinomonadaceae bacterium]